MAEMADKNYISGILIKEFGEYGQLNISIKIDDFVKRLNGISNNGWANICIAKNRKPTEKGYTHHCFENTWKKTDSKSAKTSKQKDNLNELPF